MDAQGLSFNTFSFSLLSSSSFWTPVLLVPCVFVMFSDWVVIPNYICSGIKVFSSCGLKDALLLQSERTRFLYFVWNKQGVRLVNSLNLCLTRECYNFICSCNYFTVSNISDNTAWLVATTVISLIDRCTCDLHHLENKHFKVFNDEWKPHQSF